MRRIVVSEFVSLDGVVEDPGWTFRFGSEKQERFKLDEPPPSPSRPMEVLGSQQESVSDELE
jgi:hypothetical protein